LANYAPKLYYVTVSIMPKLHSRNAHKTYDLIGMLLHFIRWEQ